MANIAWKRKTISVDPKVWDEAQEVIKGELNMTVSKYIEIMLRQLVASQTQTQRQMYENLAGLLVKEMLPKSGQKVDKKLTKKK